MRKKLNFFDILLDIIIILLAILAIYWIIKLILGGGADLEEVNLLLIIMLAGFFIKIYREIGELHTWTRYSFNKTKDDIQLIKRRLRIK